MITDKILDDLNEISGIDILPILEILSKYDNSFFPFIKLTNEENLKIRYQWDSDISQHIIDILDENNRQMDLFIPFGKDYSLAIEELISFLRNRKIEQILKSEI